MISVSRVEIDGKVSLGLKVDLPNSPPIVAVIAEAGLVMCGLLNLDAAEKIGLAAAAVSGVQDVDGVLDAEVKAVTSGAEKRGVVSGLRGREAVKLLS
jgi:uncharacterized protein YunC (DUF1805 family)